MFKYVHHIHYVVHDRDAMVDYLEKTFGLKPHLVVEYAKDGMKDAHYNIGKTSLQITQPMDNTTVMGKRLTHRLATVGQSVWHIAWAVDDIEKSMQEIHAKGIKTRSGVNNSPRGYKTANIDIGAEDHSLFQIAEIFDFSKEEK